MATTTKNIAAKGSAYTHIINQLIFNNACDVLSAEKSVSDAKNNIISGLKSLQECARYASDHAAYMVINDTIDVIESGKSLRAFV
ncbi:hypothetical protein J4872_002632 [Escherichia coli]|uniref:hypothetical protein n=1 Tax=Escherichia coli TaxID=562 RepID=UPI000DA5CD98|nr:hypothetical protein [Escherichia coli]EEW2300062.1 hypothetical protein [Escherichia coli]EFH6213183.1 hypothetical protein [Escherichia coli]EFH9514497.1 hypothetical protein [Escherichia coli]EFI2446320.1 hypothetical protein [Escherichia coli]EFJ3028629.1 hypothetical protein [Escherichia coli]